MLVAFMQCQCTVVLLLVSMVGTVMSGRAQASTEQLVSMSYSSLNTGPFHAARHFTSNNERHKLMLSPLLSLSLATGDREAVAAELATAAKSGSIAELVSSGVFTSISASLADAKNQNGREGGLLAIAALAGAVGRPAEPYLMPLLGQVLGLLADKAAPVRTAAASAQVGVRGGVALVTGRSGGDAGAFVSAAASLFVSAAASLLWSWLQACCGLGGRCLCMSCTVGCTQHCPLLCPVSVAGRFGGGVHVSGHLRRGRGGGWQGLSLSRPLWQRGSGLVDCLPWLRGEW
jgi:hypothetical protein